MFAADDARRVLTVGQRWLRLVPAEPRAERWLLNQIVARPETLRRVAATKTAICRASVRSEAHI